MDLSKKDATQFAQTSASNSDVEHGAIGTTYEVKRDLGRRHINMIAIAGMIVCQTTSKHSCSLQTHASTLGYRTFFSIRPGHRYRRTSRRSLRISVHGFDCMRCRPVCRRDVGVHACHWRICSPCYEVRATCTRHRNRMELLVHHGNHSAS